MVRSREIFDIYIMKELLVRSYVSVSVSLFLGLDLRVGLERFGCWEGMKGFCGEFMVIFVFFSFFRKVLLSTFRVIW